MANGFAPAILKSLKALAGINYPGTKLTAAGFLGMLLENSNVTEATLTNVQGHQKTATVKYKVRQTPAMVQTSESCENVFTPVYAESPMEAVNFAQAGFYISRETVSKYLEEASQIQNIGNPNVPVIAEIADSIAHTANAIVGKINQTIVGGVTWGVNKQSGNNTARTLNIPLDSTEFNLDEGFAMLLNDAFENEFAGNLLICGAGKMNAYQLQKMANMVAGPGQNGIDMTRFAGYKFYPDLYTQSIWGADQIGVFAPGAIHLVDFQRYLKFRSGPLGNSIYFQINLPVNTGNGIVEMTFDAQLKEIDCATEIMNVYGETGTYSEGYALFLRKQYGLFQIPAAAYSGSDRLAGVNGALRYAVTNA